MTGKEASGISVFLLEELGDARLRCSQLKRYIDEAVDLIEKSEQKDHFFEVAGHLIQGIPDTLFRLERSLDAAAMAAARFDYEEIKDTLRPEKADELERALEEVRVRRIRREGAHPQAQHAFNTVILPALQGATDRSHMVHKVLSQLAHLRDGSLNPLSVNLREFRPTGFSDQEWADRVEEAMESWLSDGKQAAEAIVSVKIPEIAARLMHIASEAEATGKLDVGALSGVIADLEAGSKVASKKNNAKTVSERLEKLALDLTSGKVRPSRLGLAKELRGIAGPLKAKPSVKTAAAADKVDELPATQQLAVYADTFKSDAVMAWRKFGTGHYKLGFVELSAVVMGIDHIAALFNLEEVSKVSAILVRKLIMAKSRVHDGEIPDLSTGPTLSAVMDKNKDKFARFEEGKPADPTKNMDEGEASEWKEEHDKNKDNFKEARFEEGKPADPTKDMSDEEASKWKEEHDKNKDNFKAAASDVTMKNVTRAGADKNASDSEGSWKV